MNKKKALKYTLNTLFLLAVIPMFTVLKTSYVPNLQAILLGMLIAFLATGLLIYEVYTCKTESVLGTKLIKAGFGSKLFIFSLFLFCFSCLGVYGVSYSLHALTKNTGIFATKARIMRPSSLRGSACDTRIAVVNPWTNKETRTHCASPQDFRLVKNLPMRYYSYRFVDVIYERSPFGKKIVGLQKTKNEMMIRKE